MTSQNAIYRVNKFFEDYAHALENRDSKYMLSCYALPCMFIADNSAATYTTAAKLEGLINQSKRFYNKHDITHAYPDIRNKRVLTDKIIEVKINWQYANKNHKPIYDCDYYYIIRLNEDNKWKMETIISVNEQERIANL